MKGVLITGITGFTGTHIIEYLSNHIENFHIVGTSRNQDSYINDTKIIRVDLTRPDEVKDLFNEVDPEYIIHLAACIHGNPEEIFNTNVLGTVNLFDAVKDRALKSVKILVIGSVAQYGVGNKSELCIDEKASLKPINIYGNSKVSQELLGYQYYCNYGLNISGVRTSNLVGPGQSSAFVCSAIARQIVEIEKNQNKNILKVGNLDPQRDFIDVRDAVDAYWKVINSNRFGEIFNVCSGKSVAVRDILNCFLDLTDVKPEILIDSRKNRKVDITRIRYSYDKLKNLTGWNPKKNLKSTLRDVLEYWRSIL